ncbi:MAG: 30S ribosomal protein S17 [Planctomycetota bacterium]|nr:30S ribosomal protein S17 [Planctomycetota bacterium]
MTQATPKSTVVRDELHGTKVGVVISDKRVKTRTVAVEYQVRHPKYGKYLKRRSTYHVHDETNESRLGDRVEIANCRPVSKTKSWRLVRVVEKTVGQLEHKTEA